MAIQSAVLLAAENRKLRAANERVKKKRAKRKSYVGKGQVLSAQEVQEGQVQSVVEEEGGNQVIRESELALPIRAPRTCSICRSLEHTARTCPERQLIT